MNDIKRLFVVFRDGAVAAMLKRNIELSDDLPTGEIIGTKDGSIEISLCSEEFWYKRKKTVSSAEKILFLGTGNGINDTLPEIDKKYDQYGITYGWNGNVGLLTVNYEIINNNSEQFRSFCEAFKEEFSNPNANKVLKSVDYDFGETVDYMHPELITRRNLNYAGLATLAVLTGGLSLTAWPFAIDHKRKKDIIQQMYFLGVMHFYLHHLAEFMSR